MKARRDVSVKLLVQFRAVYVWARLINFKHETSWERVRKDRFRNLVASWEREKGSVLEAEYQQNDRVLQNAMARGRGFKTWSP
jgi:hypothetical protein